MDVFEKISSVVKSAQEISPGPWEDGDEMVMVLNDAVVIVSMSDDGEHKLLIKVIAGKPEFMDINLNLLGELNNES